MMKRYALHIIVAINLGLALVLAAMWFQRDGSLRHTRWIPPSARTMDLAGLLPALPGVVSADTSQFIAMLDRPLFSPTRRPPPPPPPPQAEAPPDHLSTAKLSGTYAGDGVGGVIISIDGKSRRVLLNQAVEGWTLKSVQGRSVTFARGGETRTLQLSKAAVTTYSGLPQASNSNPVAAAAPRPTAPAESAAAAGAAQGGGTASPRPAPRATFGGRR